MVIFEIRYTGKEDNVKDLIDDQDVLMDVEDRNLTTAA
jgi:hypothetical protein